MNVFLFLFLTENICTQTDFTQINEPVSVAPLLSVSLSRLKSAVQNGRRKLNLHGGPDDVMRTGHAPP